MNQKSLIDMFCLEIKFYLVQNSKIFKVNNSISSCMVRVMNRTSKNIYINEIFVTLNSFSNMKNL
jgi:hypothetical protein